MTPGGSTKKVANSLVTASCTAVLAVYVAGYARTQSAANKFTAQVAQRRVANVIKPELPPAVEGRRPTVIQPVGGTPPPPAEAFVASKHAEKKNPEPIVPPTPVMQKESLPVSVTSAPLTAAPAEASTPPPLEAVVQPAPVVVPATPLPPPAAPHPVWKDGTYTGWGFSRHGDIEAEVIILGGRITSATISECRTRYSCSVIDKLPPQVAQRQSPDVDYVSGATQSADAFYGAVVAALDKAK